MNYYPDHSDLDFDDEDDPDDNPIMRAFLQTLGPEGRLMALRAGIDINFEDFEPLVLKPPYVPRPPVVYTPPVVKPFSPDWLPPHPAVW